MHSVEKYTNFLKCAYITISFSYVYFSGFTRGIDSSSPCRWEKTPKYIITEFPLSILMGASYRFYVRAPAQSCRVAAQYVHYHRFRDVIGIMAGGDAIHLQLLGTAVQRLPTKHPTECAIIRAANFAHYPIHCPAIQLLVRQYFQRHLVVVAVLFDRFQAVVPVACITQIYA